MPIHCEVLVQPLSTEAFGELDYKVMRHAFASQNELGRLADERIYQGDLCERLQSEGVTVRRELEIQLQHQGFSKPLFLDLLVAEVGVYELKAAKAITESHRGQLLTYLHLLDLPRGKLINFGSVKVGSQFVNAPLRAEHRRCFRLVDEDYAGGPDFHALVIGLLRDWGTGLTVSLYREAIIALLGGVEAVECMLPVHRNGIRLGNQRFDLAATNAAFMITAMNRETTAFQHHLERLICYSPLAAVHWVNVGYEEVVLKTVGSRE